MLHILSLQSFVVDVISVTVVLKCVEGTLDHHFDVKNNQIEKKVYVWVRGMANNLKCSKMVEDGHVIY